MASCGCGHARQLFGSHHRDVRIRTCSFHSVCAVCRFSDVAQKLAKIRKLAQFGESSAGIIVLALSFKFLSVADLSNGWGLLNRDIFLSIWIVIAVFLGMYLLGKIKLAHDDELQHVSLTRMFLSMASFAFAIYMIPGLWGAPLKPISAILPPMETQDFKLNDASITQKFTDYETGMAYAAQTGKPVLLDFAGHGCVNCHKMDAAVLTDPHVKEIIDNNTS